MLSKERVFRHRLSAASGIWCFIGFFRVPFQDRGPDSAGFVYAKRGLGHHPAATSAPETDSAQKPETQTIPSECVQLMPEAPSESGIRWSGIRLEYRALFMSGRSFPRTIGGRRCLAIGEPQAKTELSTSRRLQAPARHRCVGAPPLAGACPRRDLPDNRKRTETLRKEHPCTKN